MSPSLPKLTLYRMDGACSLVTHLFLQELDIPFAGVRMFFNSDGVVEAADGSLSNAEYCKTVHPNGMVPALKIEDDSGSAAVLTENIAILTYLADLVPERQLAGSTALERATVLSWLAFLSGSIHGQGYGALWRPARFIDCEKHPEGKVAVQEAGRKRTEMFYGQVESRLPDSGFAVAKARNGPTAVDFYLYLFFRWGNRIGLPMVDKYPKWGRLAREVEARENTKKVVAAENIALQFP